jgi:predicted lipoprotein with Yx(FWY)xxD motif
VLVLSAGLAACGSSRHPGPRTLAGAPRASTNTVKVRLPAHPPKPRPVAPARARSQGKKHPRAPRSQHARTPHTTTRTTTTPATPTHTTTAPAGTHASTGPTRGVIVRLRHTRLGSVLTGPHGLTLYLFTRDTSTLSTCYGGCAGVWPPLLSRAPPRARAGVRAALLGSARRRNGSLQVTYAGHPLYYYAGDSAPGQTTGEGLNQFGGLWYAVGPSGAAVTG